MKLEDIGWNSFLKEQFADWCGAGFIPGRVIGEAGHLYFVETEKGRSDAVISGHFQYTAAGPGDYPAVGDWVLMRGESDPQIIEKILERESVFLRRAAGKRSEEQVIAANIDIMFIVAALDGGRNFTLRGLERYIVMVSDGGADPVIILNKCDLCSESERDNFTTMARSVSGDIPVFMVSALTGEGIEHMNSLLAPGVTAAFTGPSGAGKSALINQLIGRSVQKTGVLREDDKRGRHTTTSKELFFLSSGAMVIDTPGLRELRPYGDTESLDSAFTEIAGAADGCRFNDCTHTNEPGCSVLGLVSDGIIEYARYQSYITIRGEIESFSLMKSEKGRMARKSKEKSISKIIKKYHRDFKE